MRNVTFKPIRSATYEKCDLLEVSLMRSVTYEKCNL